MILFLFLYTREAQHRRALLCEHERLVPLVSEIPRLGPNRGPRGASFPGSAALQDRRSHGGAVHVVLERNAVDECPSTDGLRQVEVLVVIKTSLGVHVVVAVGRARGSGAAAWSGSGLLREGCIHTAGGPPVQRSGGLEGVDAEPRSNWSRRTWKAETCARRCVCVGGEDQNKGPAAHGRQGMGATNQREGWLKTGAQTLD